MELSGNHAYDTRGNIPVELEIKVNKAPTASSGVLTALFNLLVFNQLSLQGARN